MTDLSDMQLGTVRKLIEQAPDATLRSIGDALAANTRQPAAIRAISDIVNAETLDRSVRMAAFKPIAPLCAPSGDIARLELPAELPHLFWRALKASAPDAVSHALHMGEVDDESEHFREALDVLCQEAAAHLRNPAAPGFASLAARLDAHSLGAARTAQLLDLSSIVRQALPSLHHWARNLNGEYDASIRLAFRDASEFGEDCAALLMEMLFAHLDNPYHVLRLVSAVMDRPSERYLAGSEMASFGERLMEDLDRQIDIARHFDPRRGLEGGIAAAAAVDTAIHAIAEFEEHVTLSAQGPWGARLQLQKRTIALTVEARLREIEPAVNAALPVQVVRFGPKKGFGSPLLTDAPSPPAVAKAQALLGLLHGVRAAASVGGFGALRAKLTDSLTYRLDHYINDLLELLHAGGCDGPDRVRDYLDIAAEFMGLVRDPQAADIVRRRAAAA